MTMKKKILVFAVAFALATAGVVGYAQASSSAGSNETAGVHKAW